MPIKANINAISSDGTDVSEGSRVEFMASGVVRSISGSEVFIDLDQANGMPIEYADFETSESDLTESEVREQAMKYDKEKQSYE